MHPDPGMLIWCSRYFSISNLKKFLLVREEERPGKLLFCLLNPQTPSHTPCNAGPRWEWGWWECDGLTTWEGASIVCKHRWHFSHTSCPRNPCSAPRTWGCSPGRRSLATLMTPHLSPAAESSDPSSASQSPILRARNPLQLGGASHSWADHPGSSDWLPAG